MEHLSPKGLRGTVHRVASAGITKRNQLAIEPVLGLGGNREAISIIAGTDRQTAMVTQGTALNVYSPVG